MNKCIVCYKESDVIFQASSYCREHFERIWAYLNGDRIIGKNILQMKQDIAKKKVGEKL